MSEMKDETIIKCEADAKVMNSQEYWNARFSSEDWQKYGGNEQTKYFAGILMEMLPEWLIHEINENGYSICDIGCAEGEALSVYRQTFPRSCLYGEDFSESAVAAASRHYPEFSFEVRNLFDTANAAKYPVVICSNVIEHFRDTYKALCAVCGRADRHAVILIPYREKEGAIEEHEHTFHTNHIPMRIDDKHLVYAKSMNCQSPYYPYEQLLLVYSSQKKFYALSDLVENVSGDRETPLLEETEQLKKAITSAAEERKALLDRLTALENGKKQLEEAKAALAEEKDTLQQQLDAHRIQWQEQLLALQAESTRLQEQLLALQSENKLQEEQLNALQNKNNQLQTDFDVLQNENNQWKNQVKTFKTDLDSAKQSYSELNNRQIHGENALQMAEAILKQKDEHLNQAQELCHHFATGKLMQLNHFLFRIKGQVLKGAKADRKEFWMWLKGRIKHTNRSLGAGVIYNPWMVVNKKLQEAVNCQAASTVYTSSVPNVVQENVFENTAAKNNLRPSLSAPLCCELARDYTKYDVIILSVIDYNFRHQRPQHFATRFASNGHRVFYINANFIRPDSVSTLQANLFVVDFSNDQYNAIYSMDGHKVLPWMQKKFDILLFEQGIRDAVIIVDYPNWVAGAEYLRKKYGFKIVTDYMDDYTGFLGTAEDFLKDNCIRLLQCSDMIAASSQFLFEVAAKYTEKEKIEIVRNGTEVEHFYQAVRLESANRKRKVIGYYGAIAHWFAWEKVCFLARKFPECDIVIVGEVTEHRDKLEQYSNIKLLGEKPYRDLPQYLADFDVCLIPFDTSTDLIKATNPVKFYEYLSAGKKIVATEIPELMPYKNEYVYMSNEDTAFADYVKLCLEGEDCLKDKEACIAFARENDWQKRYEVFEKSCTGHIPKVSIIVLTYNNLAFNKQCIDSILHKTAYGRYELIIVDNASTDGTREYLEELQSREVPNLKVILNDQNKGFAGGNNIGIKAAEGNYILLLNNDTVVSRGWLTALIKHLENNPEYGMCNPVTNSIGNESMVRAHYKNILEMQEFAYAYTALHMDQEYSKTDRLPLFATAIRKETIDKVGILDDSYKVGMFEDDDYTERVLQGGFKITIAEDAFIHHINNGSFKKLKNEEYQKIFAANKAIFESKWERKWTMPKYREGVTADCNADCSV